ncbi:MAG TPA: NAD(P)/FAD-dependent oxidoreductase [Actinospica sp.]|jgi:dihydrolipoamide dehydrogenase|nr:NAD(P)/FAD-dependent oxidoreductase [Actinospica sp.]
MDADGHTEGTDTWDVIVLGGGPAGENAAQYAIQRSGRTAVLIEAELVGGECSYWACMPSKALLRPVEVLDAARSLPGVLDTRLDVPAILARRDEIISHRDDSGQVDWARSERIDVLRGVGRLDGDRTVVVTGADGEQRRIFARHAVVLATGTTAALPPVPGLAEAHPWISRDATNLAEVPGRIAVIGGGVVGCEAATWLAAFGAEVTLIQSNPRLLPRNEPFVHDLVAKRLEEAGVKVRLGAHAQRVERADARAAGVGRIHGGEVVLTVDGERLVVDEVLVAAGRTPATGDLGLDTVGLGDLAERRGFVPVDEQLTVRGVTGDWLYAVGDVNGLSLLTHMGKYQARVCGEVIAARAEAAALDSVRFRDIADTRAVPQVVFTDPQVAAVGLTEKAARDAGIDVETVEHDLAALAATYVQRADYRGRAKLVIDREADVLVGATFVGPEVAELVHAATVAVIGQVPLELLRHAVPSYPTVSEVWLRLLEAREPREQQEG